MALQSKCFLFPECEWGRESFSWLRAITEDCWEKPNPWWLHWVSESSNPEACLPSGFSLRGLTLNCASMNWFLWCLQYNELWHRSALGTDSHPRWGWPALKMALLSPNIFTSPCYTTWNATLVKKHLLLKMYTFLRELQNQQTITFGMNFPMQILFLLMQVRSAILCIWELWCVREERVGGRVWS